MVRQKWELQFGLVTETVCRIHGPITTMRDLVNHDLLVVIYNIKNAFAFVKKSSAFAPLAALP